MLLFALAHLLKLSDGAFAVRSADYPDCEGRNPEMWPARQQFRLALSERVQTMIDDGSLPNLYESLAEVKPIFPAHCNRRLLAPDRLPNSFDWGLIEFVELNSDYAKRLSTLRKMQNGGRTQVDAGID